MLELRLLSRPRVTLDGEVVGDFVSDKALALLLYLALNEGAQSRQALAGLLWGEMPAKRARGNLRVALHNLKKLVSGYLDVTRKRVSFTHDRPHWIDVVAFEQAVEEGEDPDTLADALALYEHHLLNGLNVDGAPALETWLQAEQERVRLLLIDLLERLAEQHSARRQWADAMKAMRRLLAIEPWRERTHRELMLLLARQGEYGPALAQYEQCRQLLATELGMEPMPDTVSLADRIRKLRTRPRHNLPLAPGPLVGRKKELAILCRKLGKSSCRLLTIIGLGGIGKTRLALAALEEMAEAFLDGVFYVPLAPLTSVRDLASAISTVVEPPFSNRPVRDELLHYLEGKEVLLLLDNYEHLLPDVSLIDLILERCPEVKVLVTSRVRLQHRRESLYDLSGLAIESEADAATSDAADLFLFHARRVRAEFEPDDPTATMIMEICGAVEGVPLAIELAAAGIRESAVEEIAGRIRRDATALSGPVWGAPERHRSVEAAFDHSWSLLDPEERELFARLSIFRGGFTLEAAETVSGATAEALQSLVDKRLLQFGDENRYHLHELLRQYGARKLAETEQEPDEVARRHMRYYAGVLASEPPGTPMARKVIGADLDNIRLAWDTAVRRSDYSLLNQMVLPLVIFYYGRRRWHEEAERRLSAAVTAVRGRDDVDRPDVQRALGNLTAWLGYFTDDPEAFFRLTDEAVQLLRPVGAGPELAAALSFRGDAAYGVRQVAAAVDDLQESRTTFEDLGDLLGLSAPLNSLTLVYGFLGNYEAAARVGEECIAISDQIGLDKMSSMVRTHLSNALRVRGDYERATALATEALRLAEKIGSAEHKIISLIRLAEVAFDSKRYEEAEAYLSTVLNLPDVAEEQPTYQIQALALYGQLCYEQGRSADANDYVTRALSRALEMKTVETFPDVLRVVACLLEDDRPARAAEILALLRDHRHSDAETKAEAAERLAHLLERLPDDVFEAARGRAADLWTTAKASHRYLLAATST